MFKKFVIVMIIFLGALICMKDSKKIEIKRNNYMVENQSNKTYSFGDKVYYNGEVYYVLDDSDENTDYVTVLKEEPITNEYTDLFADNQTGYVVYQLDKKCYYKNTFLNDKSGCSTNYDNSFVKVVIDSWVLNELDSNDLKEVNGYTARIFSQEDLDSLGVVNNNETTVPVVRDEMHFSWLEDDISYWTMIPYNDSNFYLYYFDRWDIMYTNVLRKEAVKPVINLKKSALGTDKHFSEGELITYKDNDYYVITDGDDYVTAIKDKVLNAKQIFEYGGNTGEIHNVFLKVCSDCEYTYDNSNLKQMVDYWASKNFDENALVEIDGYKARLLTLDYLFNNYNLEWNDSYYNISIKHIPEWFRNQSYYLMDIDDQFQYYVYGDYLNKRNHFRYTYSFGNTIRPVVNIKKSALGKAHNNSIQLPENNMVCKPKYKQEKVASYKSYNHYDEITYKGEKYYVINDSDETQNYVTVLKDEFLKKSDVDIKAISDNFIVGDSLNESGGLIEFYVNNNCKSYYNSSGCTTNYNSSNIKHIVDNWMNIELDTDDLVAVDGYMVRVLNASDLDSLGIPYDISLNSIGIVSNDEELDWLDASEPFWTMIPSDNSANTIYNYSYDGYMYSKEIYEQNTIKPVINLKKSALAENQIYEIGEIIKYKDNDYYIIGNDSNKNYYVLLKVKSLTKSQVDFYKDIPQMNQIDDYIYSRYYFNEKCQNYHNYSECTSEFNKSIVKQIIDKWVVNKSMDNDLVMVDGYKARLLTTEELFDYLGYEFDFYGSYSSMNHVSENVPKWIYDKRMIYWTMKALDDSNYIMIVVMENGDLGSRIVTNAYSKLRSGVFVKLPIRPVLNINKCALEGGCFEKIIEIEDGCEDVQVVDVESTLSVISNISLVISILLIMSGSAIMIYNIYFRKDRK